MASTSQDSLNRDELDGVGHMVDESVLVLDFGSQYAQLIARRVREQNVYCEIVRHDISLDSIRRRSLRQSFCREALPAFMKRTLLSAILGYSISGSSLGICYGMQLIANSMGGKVTNCSNREFGRARFTRFKLQMVSSLVYQQIWKFG